MVSALGAKTAMALTDRGGRFELRTLSPGPYLVRAHITGFLGSRGQIVEVRASTRTASSIALRHASPVPSAAPARATISVLAAGVGAPVHAGVEALQPPTTAAATPAVAGGDTSV